MRLECGKDSILLYAESPVEETYLEEVLHLRSAGDVGQLVRHNRPGDRSALQCVELRAAVARVTKSKKEGA